ncbi:Pyrroline-5-carboxylate reductase 1 [Melia azedarach]|uniref:Pyrroline-5-carboxylate reductase 1 n=1 Tax=Melia azedarach TaxID=155640 RepID=A0ACC1Z2F6_MELAZ|nr:Pyrroline-5-carboxylate reductase 1 [Melia azedarach]
MADNVEQQEHEPSTPTSPTTASTSSSSSYKLFIRIMSKRRTWVCLFVLVYGVLLSSSWNFLKSILSWYKLQAQPSSSSGWPALYASVLLGAVFGLLAMAAALAVAVPATLVIWITVVVLLAFFGKPRTTLVIEGRKITREIVGFVFKILLKEGNIVAAVCAVLGYFALVRRNCGDVE